MSTKTDWAEAFKPLLKKYKGRKHPLEYENLYQLMVMVILAAQSTDKLINDLSAELFKAFPGMADLAKAKPELLVKYIGKVRNFKNKTQWLIDLALKIKTDKNIPLTMEELVNLPGIGRKTANVILREAGAKAVGVIVDLHVVRVAPRIGIASGTDPKKIEKQLMENLPEKMWSDAGMSLSFLGREICRPTKPDHSSCIMKNACAYYSELQS